MSTQLWAKVITLFVLSVGVLFGAVSAESLAAGRTVITVQSVDELYAAVYDEDGQPRDDVEIILVPGPGGDVLTLDPFPSRPFGGRLVLGKNTVLRSSLEMAVDEYGAPTLGAEGEPLEPGVKIDGSAVAPDMFGEGLIVVGDKGLVEQLWIDGSNRPGIAITSRGTVRKVLSTRNTLGGRIHAVDEGVAGTFEGSLFTGNLLGISIVASDGTISAHSDNVKVKARLRHNASVDNAGLNMFVNGGISTSGNELHVEAFHNVFRGANTNVSVVGGMDWSGTPGGSNNRVLLILNNNLIASGNLGISVVGGRLARPDSEEERQSSNNSVKVIGAHNTFQGNGTDIEVYGALSSTGEPGGDHNEVKVVIPNDGAIQTPPVVFSCFPVEDFPSCTNTARIVELDD
jgi:hypothetical protein